MHAEQPLALTSWSYIGPSRECVLISASASFKISIKYMGLEAGMRMVVLATTGSGNDVGLVSAV